MKCEFTPCVKVEIKLSDRSDPNKVILKLLEL